MSKTKEQIIAELDAKIPRSVVSEREGGAGRSFSYLKGHYVIARLNEVLGQGNWSYITEEVRQVYAGEINGKHHAHYIAIVRLEAPGLGSIFSDVGYGDGMDKFNPGKAHELAAKEAVTDAMKRAAKNLGMSMGLALYDTEQTNVDDSEETAKPAAAQRAKPEAKRATAAKEAAPVEAQVQERPTKENNIPETPPANRDQLNLMITNMSKVILAKHIKTLTDMKADLEQKYGTSDKNKLKDEQAKEVYKALRSMIS